jgi:hypothetical protein
MRSRKGAKVRSTRDSWVPRKKGPPEGAAPSSRSTVSIVRMKPSLLASWPLQGAGQAVHRIVPQAGGRTLRAKCRCEGGEGQWEGGKLSAVAAAPVGALLLLLLLLLPLTSRW